MTAKPKICLLDDWRRVLRRAWSIRFSLLAAAFTAAEVVVPLFGDRTAARARLCCWPLPPASAQPLLASWRSRRCTDDPATRQ